MQKRVAGDEYYKDRRLAALMLQAEDILSHAYPRFVWASHPDMRNDGVPVFIFHDITAEDFEKKLRFLKENEYHTVDADAIHGFLLDEVRLPSRSVVLTLDDGRRDVWTIAYPLLKKYGCKAVVFLIPSYVADDSTPGKNLEDVWAGRATMEDLSDGEHGDRRFISWAEACVMHEDGVVDFQSHGLYHRPIPVSERIVDFVRPGIVSRFFFDFGIPLMDREEAEKPVFSNLYGAPIYEYAPLFSERRQYREDPCLSRACLSFVDKHGRETFFMGSGWRRRLMKSVKSHRKQQGGAPAFETGAEQRRRMEENLRSAREIIEDRLPGKSVGHLAYPWGKGSDVAVKCSKRSGYVSNFWRLLPNRRANKPGDDPYHTVRLKHDFIWRLPGKGRKSLPEVFGFKAMRRLRGIVDY